MHVEGPHILPPIAIWTVLAIRVIVQRNQVPGLGDMGDKVPRVLATGAARKRIEMRRFGRGALDLDRGQDTG